MSKSTIVLLSAVLLGALPAMSTAWAEGEVEQAQPQTDQPTVEGQNGAVPSPQLQNPAVQPAPDANAQPNQEPAVQPPQAAAPDADGAAKPDPANPYEVKSFFADFQHFTYGSVVPDRYRSKKYIVADWKTRNLPAPQAGSHWTYMGGNYVLISDDTGQIIRAESGEIFYKQ